MKAARVLSALALTALLGVTSTLGATGDAASDRRPVVVIAVSGMVDDGLAKHVIRSFTQHASERNVVYVLEISTFGGNVGAAYDIADAIMGVDNGTTIAYVKDKAISAGALVALACDRLYMAPGTTIGDCAPIIPTLGGPKEAGEKYQSPLRAKFRAMALRNGFSPVLAEAMVTKSSAVYRVVRGDSTSYVDAAQLAATVPDTTDTSVHKTVVVQQGQLLTMTDTEAQDLGFSRGTVTSVEEILTGMGVTNYSMKRGAVREAGLLNWDAMSGLEKVYWMLAIPATVLFLLMAVLSFTGMAGGELASDMHVDIPHGMSASHDGAAVAGGHGFLEAFQLFSFRNLVVFFMMFAWTGIAMIRSNAPLPLALVVSLLVGVLFMFLVAFMFYAIARMVHSGNVSMDSAVGSTGTVYIGIPGGDAGFGKVNVTVEGKVIEYKAVTKGEKIPTGVPVKVTALENGMLVVEKVQ